MISSLPVVIITGASRGIGQATALAFAKRGYAVGLNYLQNEPGARETEKGVKKAGGQALLLKADVRDSKDVEAMVKMVAAEWGRLDVLVNNAGITRDRRLHKLTDDDWQDVLAVHLNGAFYCTRSAIPLMKKNGGGSIVNITSFLAKRPRAGAANYAAAKAGLISLTQSTAVELGGDNIRANAVMPGFHITDMNRAAWAKVEAEVRAQHLLGRMSSLESLGDFVCHVAGLPDVTGQLFCYESRI